MASDKITNYLKLEQKLKKISHLRNIASVVHWDAAVMLKAGSASARNHEIATLDTLIHKLATSKEIGDLIEQASLEQEHLNEWQVANLKLAGKFYDDETCITAKMKHEFSIAASQSEFTWRKCKAENDFNTLIPHLDRVFKIAAEVANAKAARSGKPAYDTLVDSFDPERELSEINSVYNVLKTKLPDLINKIIEKQSSEKLIPLSTEIDYQTQKAIGVKILEKMGFDLSRGRLDESAHPFCSGSRFDVRLTTRYDKNNFLSGLLGVIHEAGHGLYQQNLPELYSNQPVGNPKGMAFHESQSLIMEMQAAITKQFTEFLAKLLKDEFNFKGPEYSADNLYKLMTRVKRSFIRVDADEVTYPLHVILRVEIEQKIIDGTLKAADLPEIWNNKMKEYLDIVPSSFASGCLQDIHWPSGSFGYFPSYTNGAIIASMVMKKALEQNGNILPELNMGNFASLNDYLTKNLRQHGSLKSSKELLRASTGYEQIQPDIFIEHLRNKYL